MLYSVLILACVVAASATNAPLYMLTDSKAKCLDGTQAGYYYEGAADSASSKKWVIYLNGGGECDSESACKSQTGGSLGSSKYFSSTSDSSGWYVGSAYCANNPDFCGWNHVLDPYCSQDLHAGQRTEASADTWDLYFSGYHIFTATLDALDKEHGLAEATDIILQGVSAGGIGVWMNLDYLAQRYPKAKVTGLTIAGHYFYATYFNGTHHTNPGGMADFRESAWPTTYALYDAFVDADCKAAYEAQGLNAGSCMLSNNSLPYISSDAFVVQAQTDQVVLTGHDCWPESTMAEEEEQTFMKEWHANMSTALIPLLARDKVRGPHRGVFAAACYTHTGFFSSGPFINGLNYNQAFSNYYYRSTPEAQYKISDDCGIQCNPTCV